MNGTIEGSGVVQLLEEGRRRSSGRVPPHNLEAEESLLGAMLLSRDAITAAVEARVDATDFYKPAHTHIFEAVMALYGQGEPVDPVSVAEQLRRAELLDALGGKATLLRIQAGTPASANAGHYATIVSELALLRRLITVAGDIAEMGYDTPDDVTETLDRAESLVFEVAERRVSESLVGISDSLQATLDQLESMYGRDTDVTGVPTGYQELDDLLLGLQPSNLVIVAARPGAGKTSFALGAASNAALVSRRPVMFFSMEMGNLELTKRLLAGEARVEARKLWTGNIPESDWTRLSHAVGRLAEAPLFIDDNPHCTVMEMRAKARRIKARHGDLGMIVVDYIQLMSSGVRNPENRQVEVSDLSRGLKILARELDCPVMALSQLNRQLEYRQDKRPMLADLRESGCLTADTLVTRADTGADVTMGELLERGERDIPVWTLDEHYKLVRGVMTHVFPSGVKPVFELRLASGRTVKASANHPFLTLDGWARLDELTAGSRIAVPRRLPSPQQHAAWPDHEVILLAHMIGDGCHLKRHALQYTTTDPANVEAVAAAARPFGIEARTKSERNWTQVFLPAPFRLTHGKRNPVAAWLDGLGLFGKRSWEKFVPRELFSLDDRQLRLFLRHLWATDGSMTLQGGSSPKASIYYSSTSPALARDVQALLLRLGIRGRLSVVHEKHGRVGHQVRISGWGQQFRFLELIGSHGARGEASLPIRQFLLERHPNTNVDTIPREIWEYVRHKVMPTLGVSARELAERIGMQYCGSTLYKHGVSRERMSRVAKALPDPLLRDLASSDVLWDEVVEITPLGEAPVFDATVPDTHNFLANGLVAHNSIEQDADVVCFIYRDEIYNPESDQRGTAEIIVAKHRNGPTGSTRLAFLDHLTKFANMARD